MGAAGVASPAALGATGELTASSLFAVFTPFSASFAWSAGASKKPTAIAAKSLIGHLGDMRPAHDHGNTGTPNGVGHAIGFGNHASHSADADQPDLLVADILRDLGFVLWAEHCRQLAVLHVPPGSAPEEETSISAA